VGRKVRDEAMGMDEVEAERGFRWTGGRFDEVEPGNERRFDRGLPFRVVASDFQ